MKDLSESSQDITTDFLLERMSSFTGRRIKLEKEINEFKTMGVSRATLKTLKKEESFLGREARRLVGVLMSRGVSQKEIASAVLNREKDSSL